MAYYCKIVEPKATRPSLNVIMLHFAMFDDADDSMVQGPMTHGFNVTTYNEDGTVKAETGQQKLQRMAAEFNAYAHRFMTDVTLVDQNFDAVLTAVDGYRYPAAG